MFSGLRSRGVREGFHGVDRPFEPLDLLLPGLPEDRHQCLRREDDQVTPLGCCQVRLIVEADALATSTFF